MQIVPRALNQVPTRQISRHQKSARKIPKQKENRLAVEKEGMGTVIDVPAAEVPQVQAHGTLEIF